MVLELTGSKCTCARPRVGSLNPSASIPSWDGGREEKAIGHIYDRVAGKEPPTHNIASRP